ncbi:TPA: heme acquisition hemophore HasA [Yersinia enterocolitica]|uniref:heme acquisition protein HasA n=1 Tax=Yersinia enterocolitica TaxID=630 RepID=UPI0021E72DDD|nr:heme acquisition protein HasA [Yersinia enterocolitica]EKN3948871.1 heme acquisition hemophore HasA [Yersinia enterocolitica]UYJ97315.1 heme acquisition protein HasA [Yersinia enterocolitica]HDL6960373.1 heme acquisition hemophore HasA [Yersinia enterocolitica]HDL6985069.1 heme acquisition hemophore HasA [Yersinia enterocolitica]HDL7067611.1 heme acquisition hemophore HasA [Yersinia enterocolitica]
MTVTIKYQGQLSDNTLTTYIKQWATDHGDIKDTQAEGYSKDFGQFAGGSMFNGTQYSIGSSHSNASTGMIIEGNLTYNFAQHTLHGKVDSLELGENLNANSNGIGKYLDPLQLKMSGLDITGEFDPSKTMVENHQGDMHKSIYGLMRGNADPLLEVLTAKGIDVNTPLKDMAIASQFETMVSDMPMIDTVGVVESSDMLLAA